MTILVTGSSGHLGEGLVRILSADGHDVRGLDVLPGPFTAHVGSIVDRNVVRDCLTGVDAILHAATLHKPHVATHTKQDFIDTNVSGTLHLLEEAVTAGVGAFVFTSTTSAFGAALSPPEGAPAAWIDETVIPVPKNIYGVTKTAAEDLCHLFHRRHGLNCIILRTSRFFPEVDDSRAIRDHFTDENAKANEFLFRRVDLEDTVHAHIAAMNRARRIGFARYVISATTPFEHADLALLRTDPGRVVERYFPGFRDAYAARAYRMFGSIDRVYANDRARRDLGWQPAYDFARILAQIADGQSIGSQFAQLVGIKGYHPEAFVDGPYPVD